MEQNNNHIIYNAEDIHRYFSGKMNTVEMHAMEKAALSDILLAEAMEGYHQSAINSDVDYAAMQKQLDELKDKISGKTISINKRTNNWWKVAAAVLLLVSGAYAFYRMHQTDNKNNVAVIQKNEPAKTIISDSITTAKDSTINTIAQINTNTTPTRKAIRNNKPNALLIDSAMLPNDIAMNDKKEFNAERDEPSPAANTHLKATRLFAQNASPSLSNTLLFSGKITDENNNPISYAELIINNHQQSKTDANGFFNLSSSDSLLRLDISAANYYPKTITINPNNNTAIQLTLQKKSLHKNLADTLHQSIVQLLYNSGVEPKEGWEMYRLYLVNQLSNSEYDDGRKVVGETIVQFEINRINQPCNFYFEKSIDEDVNRAIENLILLQTEWRFLPNAGIPATVRLRIVF